MRLTDEEHNLLLKRMREAGIQNQDAYLRHMALSGYILRMDLSEVRETLRLIANAVSNINQIAKVANETRSIYATDVIRVHEEVADLRSQASDAMKIFSKVRKFLTL
jgi:hypothetical protein